MQTLRRVWEHLEEGFIAFLLAAMTLVTFVYVMLNNIYTLVADRLREGAVIAIAMAATACIFVVYPFMESPLTMGVCSVLLGFSLGSVQPMVMSMLHQITPQHRQGEALGLRLMVINASSVAMPMLFGAAGGVIGISALFWTVGAGVCCGVRAAWRMGTPEHIEAEKKVAQLPPP